MKMWPFVANGDGRNALPGAGFRSLGMSSSAIGKVPATNRRIDRNTVESYDLSGMPMVSAQRTYAMLGNETLWDVASLCDRVLRGAGIPYSICGGVAVCLHGYQRNTVDIDLVVRHQDAARIRPLFEAESLSWDPDAKEFRTNAGIAIQFLIAGESAGRGFEVKIPEPVGDDNVEVIEGLTVLRLSRLIETKLACGLANARRTHKEFADIVELIDIRELDGTFSRLLHKSVRGTFRELVKCARGDL